jgi:hypothetical protein
MKTHNVVRGDYRSGPGDGERSWNGCPEQAQGGLESRGPMLVAVASRVALTKLVTIARVASTERHPLAVGVQVAEVKADAWASRS